MKPRKHTPFKEDKRRKHHHWKVTIFYKDGDAFARTYTDERRATGFAERQKQSPIVEMVHVTQVS